MEVLVLQQCRLSIISFVHNTFSTMLRNFPLCQGHEDIPYYHMHTFLFFLSYLSFNPSGTDFCVHIREDTAPSPFTTSCSSCSSLVCQRVYPPDCSATLVIYCVQMHKHPFRVLCSVPLANHLYL